LDTFFIRLLLDSFICNIVFALCILFSETIRFTETIAGFTFTITDSCWPITYLISQSIKENHSPVNKNIKTKQFTLSFIYKLFSFPHFSPEDDDELLDDDDEALLAFTFFSPFNIIFFFLSTSPDYEDDDEDESSSEPDDIPDDSDGSFIVATCFAYFFYYSLTIFIAFFVDSSCSRFKFIYLLCF
jgi:hypothetical protein